MFEKLKKYFSVKSNWAYIILFFVLVVAYIWGFFNTNFSYMAIGGLFLFIAIENFLKSIGYFEDMKNNTETNTQNLKIMKDESESISKNLEYVVKSINKIDEIYGKLSMLNPSFMIKYDSECTSIPDIIKQASCEIFVSVTRISYWTLYLPQIVKRTDLKVRIVLYNSYNMDLIHAYKNMMGYEKYESSLTDVERYLNYNHIEVRVIDSIMPTIYIASDIGQKNGYIRAIHFSVDADISKHPCVELTPSNNIWFENYKEQLERVWNKATPLLEGSTNT